MVSRPATPVSVARLSQVSSSALGVGEIRYRQTFVGRTSSRAARRRGVALVWVLVTFLVVLGLAGLALDTARVLLAAHELQNAADAAALAGAAYVKADLDTLRLQAVAIARANTAEKLSLAVDPNTSNDPAGDVVVGFFNRTTGTFTVGTTNPNAVRVTAHRSQGQALPLIFGPIFGISTSNIARSAIAVQGGTTGAGMITLSSSDAKALWVNGNVVLDVDKGTVFVNSSSATAVYGSNNGTLIAPVIDVTGGYNFQNASFEGQINTGTSPKLDPLRNLTPPTSTVTQQNVRITGNATTTVWLDPGYYPNGIYLDNANATVRLRPGTYILDGNNNNGGLQVNNGTFVADGSTLYVQGGKISLTASANVELTPPTDGPYQYLSLWQAAADTNPVAISGGANLNLQGSLYFPTAAVTLTGNSSGVLQINQLIAWSVQVKGGGTIDVHYTGQEPGTGTKVFLVQ